MTIRWYLSALTAMRATGAFLPSFTITTTKPGWIEWLTMYRAFAAGHQLNYLLLTPTDFYRDLHEPDPRGGATPWRPVGARELYRSAAAICSIAKH